MGVREEKRAFWIAAINESRRSGENIVDWCRCRGLSVRTYYYWYKALANERRIQDEGLSKNQGTYGLVPKVPSSAPVFAEVDLHRFDQTVPGEKCSVQQYKADVLASQIILEKGGCLVHIGTGFDADTLKQVLEVL